MRARLELPDAVEVPPDLTVPLIVPPEMVTEWEARDAAGSAENACALGRWHLQCGRLDEAQSCFTRAAERGSAAGAYARAYVASSLGSDDTEVLRLLSDADAAGSALAAADRARLFDEEGDSAGAAAATQRARCRAHAGDEAGSADAALLLSMLLTDPAERTAALQRACERGSSLAAVYVGDEAEQSGDHDRAVDAYLLAVKRGQVRAGLRMGAVLAGTGRRRAARRAWAQARQHAIVAGDEELFAAAHAELAPPLRTVLGRHKPVVFLVACAMAAPLLTGGWRWTVTLVLAVLGLLLFRAGPVVGALYTPADGSAQGMHSFRGGGLSVVGVVADEIAIGGPPVPRKVAGRSDVIHARLLAAAYAAVVVAVGSWAGGRITFTRSLAYVTLASAVSLAFVAVRSFTRAWQRPGGPADGGTVDDTDDDRRAAAYGEVAIGVLPFTRFSFRIGVRDPRITDLVAASRAARPEFQPLWARRVEATLGAVLGLIGSGVLALPALAPGRVPSFRTLTDTIEMVAAAWILVVCGLRVTYAVHHRHDGWAVAAGLYTALAAAIATLASFLGVWDRIGVVLSGL